MPKKNKVNKIKDLKGISQLATDATNGITDIVESMHRRILYPPFLPATPIQGAIMNIAKLTYSSVKSVTKIIGKGIDKTLGQFDSIIGESESSERRTNLISALNGVVGDYLEAEQNPLALEMEFKYQGKAISLDEKSIKENYKSVNGHILLMIHGSCMNDLLWNRNDHDHGKQLAADFNLTPIYLQYNSGRHISSNGQTLNNLLEALITTWPVKVKSISILAHSMGGLVSRSAIHYANQEKKSWIKKVDKIIFLGTPHQGAPLEKAGSYVDFLLESIPYTKPLARLGKIRSAGVTDLRHGYIRDEDWNDSNETTKQAIKIPTSISAYNIAAVLKKKEKKQKLDLIGDGLVPLKSAFGEHRDPLKKLAFLKKNNWVYYEMNHLDLLSDQKVYRRIKKIFSPK